MKLENLIAKQEKIQRELDAATADGRFRNIAFCSGGNLSKASYNYKLRHTYKISRLCGELHLCERAIRIVSGEPFKIVDLWKCQLDIQRVYTEYERSIGQYTGIIFAADAVRLSFFGKYRSVIERLPIILDFETTNKIIYSVYPNNRIEQQKRL